MLEDTPVWTDSTITGRSIEGGRPDTGSTSGLADRKQVRQSPEETYIENMNGYIMISLDMKICILFIQNS
jgi:hypothetical protein